MIVRESGKSFIQKMLQRKILSGTICVTYSDGRLTDVDVKDIAGGENKVVFDAVTAGDECVIFVFETLTNIVPLTKCKHVVGNN